MQPSRPKTAVEIAAEIRADVAERFPQGELCFVFDEAENRVVPAYIGKASSKTITVQDTRGRVQEIPEAQLQIHTLDVRSTIVLRSESPEDTRIMAERVKVVGLQSLIERMDEMSAEIAALRERLNKETTAS